MTEKSLAEFPLRFREFWVHSDTDFVFASWLQSYRNATKEWPWFEMIGNQVFYDSHRHLITNILKKADVLILCNEEDPTQLFGYVAHEDRGGHLVVHYIYIKQPFRGFGLGSAALKALMGEKPRPVTYTHYTHSGFQFLKSLELNQPLLFDPYGGIRHEISRT